MMLPPAKCIGCGSPPMIPSEACCDGVVGLQIAVEEIPDFIYRDIRMPGLDAFEVLENLRRSATTLTSP